MDSGMWPPAIRIHPFPYSPIPLFPHSPIHVPARFDRNYRDVTGRLRPAAPQMRVLIVEDDAATRALLVATARDRHHDVQVYADAEAVWTALSGGAEPGVFDVAVVDIGLPGQDGVDFCRQFRRHAAGRHAIVVLVTADERIETLEAALQAGAHDYLTKPIDRRHLGIRLAIAEQRSLAHATSRYSREALRESEHRFEAFMNNSPTLAFIKDAQGRYLYVNRRYMEAFGVAEEDRIGRTVQEVMPPEIADRMLADDREVIESGRARESIHRVTGSNGVQDWLTCKFPLADTDGRPSLVAGIAIDITDRLVAEAALRASEERLRLVFEATQEGLWEWELSTNALTWSDRVFEMLRLPRDGVRPTTDEYFSRIHPDDRALVRAALDAHLSEGHPYNLLHRIRRADGTWAYAECRGQAVRDSAGRPARMVGSIADVTARVEASEEMRRQKARAEALLEIGSHVNSQRDLQAVLQAVCDRTREALDVSTAAVFIHDLPARMLRVEAISGGPPDLHDQFVPTPVDEHLKLAPLTTSVMTLPVLRDATFVPNIRVLVDMGMQSAAFARMVQDGELVGLVGVGEFTRREFSPDDVALLQGVADQAALAIRGATLLEQRRRAEEQMRNAQKLESLGVLAGGIAHDFNNLLVGVLGNAGLAMLELPPDSPARQAIRDIEMSAQRAAELTRQMLAYSGRGSFRVEPVDVSDVVEEMTQLLRRVISKQAQLSLRLGRQLPAVVADATQLRQVVMNLITNASDALGDRLGTITLETGVVEANRQMLASTYLDEELPAGQYVYIDVTDTGEGMDAATSARIFEPFFTTKFTGRGLGLAAVLGIVRGHKGAIALQSTPGAGTRFRVLLPATAGIASLSIEPAAAALAQGSGRVLLVDDEEAVRGLARRVLERGGFDVVEATSGEDALAQYNQEPGAVAAVVLDLTMPGLSGEATFHELRRLRPDLPVVLSSGYVPDEGSALEGVPFLAKPYRPTELVDAVKGAMTR
jgi:PAS domain S-box-containing protein